jgi:hypothetical protein
MNLLLDLIFQTLNFSHNLVTMRSKLIVFFNLIQKYFIGSQAIQRDEKISD